MIETLLHNIERLLPELPELTPRKGLAEVVLGDLDKTLAQAAGFPEQAQAAPLDRRAQIAPIRQRSSRPLRPVRPRRAAPLARPKETLWQALRELRDYYDRTDQSTASHASLTLSEADLALFTEALRDQMRWYQQRYDTCRFADLVGDWDAACALPLEVIDALRASWPHAKGNLPQVPVIADGVRQFCEAVWEYGRRHGFGGEELLALPLTREGFEQFTEPLWRERLADCWPACSFYESVLYEDGNPLTAYERISLPVAFCHWDDDYAELFQAFLTGADGVAGLLDALLRGEHGDTGITLRRADERLIAKVGLRPLLDAYLAAPGAKLIDLAKLANHWESYFGELFVRFPHHQATYDFCMISTDTTEVEIASADDLEFVFGYYDCWERLLADMPGQGFMEGVGVAELVADICAVYRRERRRRPQAARAATTHKEAGYDQAA